MNQATSNSAVSEELQGVVQNKRHTGMREQEEGSYTRQKKVGWLL